MNGEIDLELYTLSIIQLNTAFQKLENSEITEELIYTFENVADDFQRLYEDIINDLNCEEVNFGEYYPFFQNGKQTFPQYLETLENMNCKEIEESLNKLTNVFTNLNKIAKEFKRSDEYGF